MTTRFPASPPDTDPESLFARLGGEVPIQAVMDGLFGRIMNDPELAPIFGRVNIERHSRRTAAFVWTATGGPHAWSGRDMVTAHRHLGVTNAQFDRVAAHLDATLDEMAVPAGPRDELLTLVGSLRSQIVADS